MLNRLQPVQGGLLQPMVQGSPADAGPAAGEQRAAQFVQRTNSISRMSDEMGTPIQLGGGSRGLMQHPPEGVDERREDGADEDGLDHPAPMTLGRFDFQSLMRGGPLGSASDGRGDQSASAGGTPIGGPGSGVLWSARLNPPEMNLPDVSKLKNVKLRQPPGFAISTARTGITTIKNKLGLGGRSGSNSILHNIGEGGRSSGGNRELSDKLLVE